MVTDCDNGVNGGGHTGGGGGGEEEVAATATAVVGGGMALVVGCDCMQLAWLIGGERWVSAVAMVAVARLWLWRWWFVWCLWPRRQQRCQRWWRAGGDDGASRW